MDTLQCGLLLKALLHPKSLFLNLTSTHTHTHKHTQTNRQTEKCTFPDKAETVFHFFHLRRECFCCIFSSFVHLGLLKHYSGLIRLSNCQSPFFGQRYLIKFLTNSLVDELKFFFHNLKISFLYCLKLD